MHIYIYIYIYVCIAPASEGRSSPFELYVQLPSGPLLVPSLAHLLSHLASAVGKAPLLYKEIYRNKSLTVEGNPLL